jgi:hypothetical protein
MTPCRQVPGEALRCLLHALLCCKSCLCTCVPALFQACALVLQCDHHPLTCMRVTLVTLHHDASATLLLPPSWLWHVSWVVACILGCGAPGGHLEPAPPGSPPANPFVLYYSVVHMCILRTWSHVMTCRRACCVWPACCVCRVRTFAGCCQAAGAAADQRRCWSVVHKLAVLLLQLFSWHDDDPCRPDVFGDVTSADFIWVAHACTHART